MTKTGTDAKNNEAVKPQTASETAATEITVADTVGDDGAGVLAVTGARVNNLQNIDVTRETRLPSSPDSAEAANLPWPLTQYTPKDNAATSRRFRHTHATL